MGIQKKLFTLAVVSALSLTVTSEASAYSLIGQKMTQTPYHLYYWGGGVTTNLGGYNAQNTVDLAMTTWTNTPNTKISMIKTTDQVSSVMDFKSASHSDINELGWTTFYNGSTLINPQVTSWSWSEMHINSNSGVDWMHDPAGKYVDPNGKQQHVLAHEAGHGFGLDHVYYYLGSARSLMLTSPTSYYDYGSKGPGDDETAGVQALYGNLY